MADTIIDRHHDVRDTDHADGASHGVLWAVVIIAILLLALFAFGRGSFGGGGGGGTTAPNTQQSTPDVEGNFQLDTNR